MIFGYVVHFSDVTLLRKCCIFSPKLKYFHHFLTKIFSKPLSLTHAELFVCVYVRGGGGEGQWPVVPLLGPPFFPIILFGSTTLLSSGMTGISLHMQWPLTSVPRQLLSKRTIGFSLWIKLHADPCWKLAKCCHIWSDVFLLFAVFVWTFKSSALLSSREEL
jgi:hypothetical protein